jgi:hypothetical protein
MTMTTRSSIRISASGPASALCRTRSALLGMLQTEAVAGAAPPPAYEQEP